MAQAISNFRLPIFITLRLKIKRLCNSILETKVAAVTIVPTSAKTQVTQGLTTKNATSGKVNRTVLATMTTTSVRVATVVSATIATTIIAARNLDSAATTNGVTTKANKHRGTTANLASNATTTASKNLGTAANHVSSAQPMATKNHRAKAISHAITTIAAANRTLPRTMASA